MRLTLAQVKNKIKSYSIKHIFKLNLCGVNQEKAPNLHTFVTLIQKKATNIFNSGKTCGRYLAVFSLKIANTGHERFKNFFHNTGEDTTCSVVSLRCYCWVQIKGYYYKLQLWRPDFPLVSFRICFRFCPPEGALRLTDSASSRKKGGSDLSRPRQ